MLQGPARRALAALSESLGCEIEVRTRPGLHQEQFEVEALDSGGSVKIPVPWLESREERAAAEAARRAAAAQARAAEEEARRAAEARMAEPAAAEPVSAEPAADAPAAEEPDAPPVDEGGEASILPRLQNSEDS